MVHPSRGRGRGRRRGRMRVSHGTERDVSRHFKCEDSPKTHCRRHGEAEQDESELNRTEPKENGARLPVRDFDLNLDLDENGFATTTHVSSSPAAASTTTVCEMKHDEHDAWLPQSCIEPLRLAEMDEGIEEEEDYDDDEG